MYFVVCMYYWKASDLGSIIVTVCMGSCFGGWYVGHIISNHHFFWKYLYSMLSPIQACVLYIFVNVCVVCKSVCHGKKL